MNKVIISYIPKNDTNTHMLKSIENTLLISQMTNTYIDLDVFYNTDEDIDISGYTINTDDILQKHINYVKENELLNNIKSSLRINKNTIILIGYKLNLFFLKELCPIVNEYKDIFINIFIKQDDEKLKNVSSHEIIVKENMNWEEIEQNIKTEYKENLNNNKNNEESGFINFLNKITNLTFEPIIEYSSSIMPINTTIEKIDDDEELDDSYKCISFIDKNNTLTIEKIDDDLICIFDEEGNKILLNESSKKFLISNLKNLD